MGKFTHAGASSKGNVEVVVCSCLTGILHSFKMYLFTHRCSPGTSRYLCSAGYPNGEITRPPRKSLFSPQTPDRRALLNQCMTASALGKRLTKHLQDAQLYDGQNNHGFRHGHIQNMVASRSGMAWTAIGQATHITTLSIVYVC